jgi:hypothetical protein
MNAKMAAKLILTGSLIVTVGNLLRGHDTLTAIALLALFLIAVGKVVFAIISRHGGPSQGGGITPSPPGPPPTFKPPSPPPGAPPDVYCEQQA